MGQNRKNTTESIIGVKFSVDLLEWYHIWSDGKNLKVKQTTRTIKRENIMAHKSRNRHSLLHELNELWSMVHFYIDELFNIQWFYIIYQQFYRVFTNDLG